MDLAENRSSHSNTIRSVRPGTCHIGNTTFTHSIIIPSATEVIPCDITGVEALSEATINQLCDYEPEVIILATGEHIEFPNTDLLNPLIKQNIGLEVLNNQAAARTFNVLLAEDRKVVCLMIIKA